MKKFFKALLCLLTGIIMIFAAACSNGGGENNDPNSGDNSGNNSGNNSGLNSESRPFSMSISAFDGNFNPFFSTSLSDAQIISQTQAQLITATAEGEPAAGDDWPTVAQDFTITYKDSEGNVIPNGVKTGTTEYEFLIKDGMKFSDGSSLTIKDVLFNFYVYLDPVYTGSNTMYSVNIKGLNAYRTNNANASDDAASGNSAYYALAQQRLDAILDWAEHDSGSQPSDPAVKADYDRVLELFKEELNSDWNSNATSWSTTYKDEYCFENAWEAYLFLEGVVKVQTRQKEGNIFEEILDENGKKLTTLDPWADGAYGGTPGTVSEQDIIDQMEALLEGVNDDYEKLEKTKQACIDRVYANYSDKSQIALVINAYTTGSTALAEFAAEEKAKALENASNPIDYISGITTHKVTSFNGKDLGKTQDVLKIEVNGVDPAAIWQFGVTIAPMNYYSSNNYNGVDYIGTFNGDQAGIANGSHNFGVKARDPKFFSDVLKSTDKNGLPKGAGPYMASSPNGGAARDDNDFEKNNIIYYERNPYFETMGANIENAKIKYIRYQVVDEDKIIDMISTGGIDYGEPNARSTNLVLINKDSNLSQVNYDTNGYGYIGINPKYVPDIEIRRAIMMSMDTQSIIRNYYGGNLASTIYRPMSKTSWAYPDDSDPASKSLPSSVAFEPDPAKIELQVQRAGYKMGDDHIYYNPQTNHKCVYTFTISGASTDHPAYKLFQESAKTLNSIGFKITVLNDAQALKKMAGGELAVWAAAWSSGIDPDMYQVYHKDSNATSVLNWGYPTILNSTPQDGFDYEKEKIELLSSKIEEARETTDKFTRTEIYGDCLDLVMDLAVELPTYQRHDLCVYRGDVIDKATLNPTPNYNLGLLAEIWKVDYIK